ncbi:DEAD/DEAH box helicase family protein [Bacteroides caecimuris]|uniref:DEAD/DEAH box helicase family protein n=1 Tax=Bacteroides caecimuris TaxID=1796613 RepID=UPI0026580C6E|nr:DEAD/DEAH box helicase family protein [Bacteroides caecimuris]
MKRLKNGNILCGGVGSGKSRTALAYYFKEQDGYFDENKYEPMDYCKVKDLYIITTARKRDTLEWESEMVPFLITTHKEESLYSHNVVVDSWNNIQKYVDVKGAFFIFDEQRVVGSGAWVKAFYKITDKNNWILLSATPGDTWQDYIPVFVANKFFKNKTEFIRNHIVYNHRVKFPKVDRYLETGKLIKLRNSILVTMDFKRHTVSHHEDVYVKYNIQDYKDLIRNRKNPATGEPIKSASEFCYELRRIVNTDISRQIVLMEILEKHPKAIIFYNFDYELELLRQLCGSSGLNVAEWNGHNHQPIPTGESWVYLVQYTAGAEGWNCITTDTIIFYSENYSYKIMEQSAGRIDRMTTPFTDLYYYHLKSRSGIELAIAKSLREKKEFNQSAFAKKHYFQNN